VNLAGWVAVVFTAATLLLTGAVKLLPAAPAGGAPVRWRRPLGTAEVILGGAVASAVAPRPTAVALVSTFAGFTLWRLQATRTGADCSCGGGRPIRTDAAVVASLGLLAVAVLAAGHLWSTPGPAPVLAVVAAAPLAVALLVRSRSSRPPASSAEPTATGSHRVRTARPATDRRAPVSADGAGPRGRGYRRCVGAP